MRTALADPISYTPTPGWRGIECNSIIEARGPLLPVITAGLVQGSPLLDWTQQDLADRAEVGIVTVRQVESGITQPRRATLEVIRRALEVAGVEFIDDNGGGPRVRLRKRQRKKM